MAGEKTAIVPCGKCHICKARRRSQWVFRLKEESKVSESCCFMTLTYQDEPESFNGHGTLKKKDFQNFMKRLRKYNANYWQHKLKYYAVGEYGSETWRPHYHIILFNLHPSIIGRSDEVADRIWKKGIVDIGTGTGASFGYVCGYVMLGSWTPTRDDDDREPHFSLMSKGLGKSYLEPQAVKRHVDSLMPYMVEPGGKLTAMPRYYKDKIFSKSEKMAIAKEAEMRNNISWEEFVNHDFKEEISNIKDGIRRQDALKRLTHGKI